MSRERFMAPFSLCIVVIFTWILSGCGASPNVTSTSDATREQQVHITPVELSELESFVKDGRLYCPFKGECEPAVAMVSIIAINSNTKKTDAADGKVQEGNKGVVERCTGFLVSKNQIVTNDHCISKSYAVRKLRNQNAVSNIPCKGLIYVHFAKANEYNDSTVDVGCESVQIRSFERGVGSKDYAVIKLDQDVVDRRPLKIANRGFLANETATIYRVQMDQKNGLQTKLECTASYKTMLYPAVTSPDSPLMTFGDCPVQPGNSGSPMINADGKVGAISQGYLSINIDDSIQKELTPRLLEESYGQVGVGTQMKCIPEFNLAYSGECSSVLPIVGARPADFVNAIGDLRRGDLPKTTAGESWKSFPAPSRDDRVFAKVPACLSVESATAGYTSIVKTYRRGLNRQLQVVWKPQLDSAVNLRLADTGDRPQASTIEVSAQELGIFSVPRCEAPRGVVLTTNP